MAGRPTPSKGARRAFVARVARFRSTLSPSEQMLLDALVSAAVLGRRPEDVDAFWISQPPWAPEPPATNPPTAPQH